MSVESPDIFPVFDPVSEEVLDYKPRGLVHRDGDWHRAVQANILRQNDQGTFDILLQERSAVVDIGLHKYDQSLATQMVDVDQLDTDATLRRGLLDELNVTDYTGVQLSAQLRIVKTYKEHEGTVNRELLDLYLVTVNDESPVTPVTPKITGIVWMEWTQFLGFFRSYPEQFTKTGQFYFSEEKLLYAIEEASQALVSGETVPQLAPQTGVVRIDRWPEAAKTFNGDLATILEETGELS